MDDNPNSSADNRLMTRLGNWLKRDSHAQPPASNPIDWSSRPQNPKPEQELSDRSDKKARMALVRKSEFDGLRRSIGQVPSSNLSHFSLVTAVMPKTSFLARARRDTRLKIDSIEEQISKSWFDSKTQQASRLGGMASRRSNRGSFTRLSSQKQMRVRVGDALVDYLYPPEAVNAATAFALGDFVSAERILEGLTARRESLGEAQVSWELRFEFYLSTGRQSEFDNLAVDYAGKFGRLPPLWNASWTSLVEASGVTDKPSPAVSPEVALTVPEPNPPPKFLVPSVIYEHDLLELKVFCDQSKLTDCVAIDWHLLNVIDASAVIPLRTFLDELLEWPGLVQFIGTAHLTEVLRKQVKDPMDDPEIKRSLWLLLLLSLQLSANDASYEEMSIEFSSVFEESPQLVRNFTARFVDLPDETAEPDEGSGAYTSLIDALDSIQATLQVVNVLSEPGSKLVTLNGTLKGDIGKQISVISYPTETEPLVFDCQAFSRIDAQAAGHLLSFLRNPQCSAGTVQFNHLSRLIAIYLFSFGLPQNVSISLATL